VTGYQLQMTMRLRNGMFLPTRGLAAVLGIGMTKVGRRGSLRLAQRGGHSDRPGTAGIRTTARQRAGCNTQTEEFAKELHGPFSSLTAPTAPSEVGRSSLVQESASRPQAVAAADQLVMQCRHPMLADVDVATRVNVHMPWVDRTEATWGVTPGSGRIVLLRCASVKSVTGNWGRKLLRCGGCVSGVRLARRSFCSSSRRRPEALLNSRMAGHPVAMRFGCRVIATWLACRGRPSSCRRSGHILLLAQEQSNQREGPPDDAPSGPLALQVRGRAPGFFDRTSLSCRKIGRIHAATLRAFLHPPAASYGDPGRREPHQELQRPALQGPTGRVFCRSALVRDQPTERWIRALRSRTSALLQGERMSGDSGSMLQVSYLWERTLCATNLRSGTSQRGCRAQGALPQTSRAPSAARVRHAWVKADA